MSKLPGAAIVADPVAEVEAMKTQASPAYPAAGRILMTVVGTIPAA